MLSVNCPKCGATTKFDETVKVPTYCMFCGAHFPDMTPYVKEALKLNQDRIRLDMDRQRHNMVMAEMDKDIRRIKAKNEFPISKLIFLILGLILLLIIKFTR